MIPSGRLTREHWRSDPVVRAKLRVLTEEWMADKTPDEETLGELAYDLFEEREARRRVEADLAAAVTVAEAAREKLAAERSFTWEATRGIAYPERVMAYDRRAIAHREFVDAVDAWCPPVSEGDKR